MPLYEFYCKKCKNTFESIELMDTRKIVCLCGADARKIMSAPNFKIEGYSEANGYANKGAKDK